MAKKLVRKRSFFSVACFHQQNNPKMIKTQLMFVYICYPVIIFINLLNLRLLYYGIVVG